jgi:hypothetical protein
MTVIFVAPDESDEEELTNCEANNHMKYKFITNDNSMRNLTLSEGIDLLLKIIFIVWFFFSFRNHPSVMVGMKKH